MQRQMFAFTTLVMLASCAGAAQIGDEALRYGSLNRVQATPFTDMVDEQDCKRMLTETFGVPHRSVTFDRGVQISQTYRCEAARIEVQVRLDNRNHHAMICAPITRLTQASAWIAPLGTASMAYVLNDASGFECYPPVSQDTAKSG